MTAVPPERWEDVVAAMRSDFAEMAVDPDHAGRFVLRLSAAHDRFQIQLARAMGLKHTDLQALLVLWDGGGMSMTALCDRIRMSRAAMTTLVDHLSGLGLIDRYQDPDDRRRALIMVSKKADRLFASHVAPIAAELAAAARRDPESWRVGVAGAAAVREALIDEAERMGAHEYARRGARGRRPSVGVEVVDDSGW